MQIAQFQDLDLFSLFENVSPTLVKFDTSFRNSFLLRANLRSALSQGFTSSVGTNCELPLAAAYL